jgi:hypothetical protein
MSDEEVLNEKHNRSSQIQLMKTGWKCVVLLRLFAICWVCMCARVVCVCVGCVCVDVLFVVECCLVCLHRANMVPSGTNKIDLAGRSFVASKSQFCCTG